MKQSNEMAQLKKWPGLKFIIGLVVSGFIAGIYFERGTDQLIRKYYDYQWIAYLSCSVMWIVLAILHAVRHARTTQGKVECPSELTPRPQENNIEIGVKGQ